MTNREKYKKAMDSVKASQDLKRKTVERLKQKPKNAIMRLVPNIAIVFLLAVSIVWITNENQNKRIEQQEDSIEIAKKLDLPTIDTWENLEKILQINTDTEERSYAVLEEKETLDSVTKASDYSQTNNQVQGVDEGDIVKTDGNYIYSVGEQEINITDIQDPNKMNKIASIPLERDEDTIYYPREMYFSNNKLIVIASKENLNTTMCVVGEDTSKTVNRLRISTTILIYNVEDKNNIQKQREVEVDGSYQSSRLIGDNFYLITNQRIAYDNTVKESKYYIPSYQDSYASNERKYKSYEDIYYFPESTSKSYANIVVLNTESKDEVKLYSFLGMSNNIYMNTQSLYLTNTKYQVQENGDIKSISLERANTEIYKFKLKGKELEYFGMANVHGSIINQFAMDETDGYFKIATTNWSDIEEDRSNNLYVFDDKLNQVGKIEGLAKGESIYSVRFMQNRAYLVTYKTIDPLFVIDLQNPAQPQVLGELKIPGVSQYLHPYDENHLIGIGKNTIEKNGRAIEKGMKISLFDVTDISNPIEQYSVNIGESGTFSEILYNHKALCYYKEKSIVAFPISMQEKGGKRFSGAIFYQIDLENGIIEKGRIEDNSRKDYNTKINRIVYAKDTFYTISRNTINSVNSNNMEIISSISI